VKYILFLFVLCSTLGFSQTTVPFAEEVNALEKKYDSLWDANKETIVFTGSSSIKYWKSLESKFPNHQIVNTGFGGSKASDLLLHTEALILNFQPKQVFIYEGDNDVSAEIKTKEIIGTVNQIIAKIKAQNANTKIVLISAKPSIARWHLKRDYKKLNRQFRKICRKDNTISYGNVWDAMIANRKVRNDIFVSDGLHMNTEGYRLWYNVIAPLIE